MIPTLCITVTIHYHDKLMNLVDILSVLINPLTRRVAK